MVLLNGPKSVTFFSVYNKKYQLCHPLAATRQLRLRNKELKLRGIVLARQSATRAIIFLMAKRTTKRAWFSPLGRK